MPLLRPLPNARRKYVRKKNKVNITTRDQEYEKIKELLERVSMGIAVQIHGANKLAQSVARLDRRLAEMKEAIAKVVES